MEEKPRKKRQPKAAKPPPKERPWVVFLTSRTKIGAPIYMAPDPDLAPSKSRMTTTKLRYAAKFATKREADRFAKFFDNPKFVNTPGIHTEEAKPAKKKPSGTRQKLLRYMED